MEWIANNWEQFPWLRRKVNWETGETSPEIVFTANVEGKIWCVRMNDFPDEPLYTLLIEGQEIIHFDDWPESSILWGRQPPFPLVKKRRRHAV